MPSDGYYGGRSRLADELLFSEEKSLAAELHVMLRRSGFRNRLSGPVVVLLSLLVATGSSFAMTRLLEKAFEKASELSEAEQDDFAEFILDELDSERRWEKAFDDSQDELERLADEALGQHEVGNSEELDSNRL